MANGDPKGPAGKGGAPDRPGGGPEHGPGESGSIDVQFSGAALPPVNEAEAERVHAARTPAPVPVPVPDAGPPLDETPPPVLTPAPTRVDPDPRPTGKPAAKTRAPTLPGKLGDLEAKIGEGIHEIEARLGEGLSHLPGVPKTRKSRVLVRSIVVGFLLVFAWIAAIVGLQLRESPAPDFRPLAEQILVALRDGKAAQVYEEASPRFQELVLEERFVEDMTEMAKTLGRFLEITSVDETEVTRGPGGRTGRVALRLQFEKGPTAGNISFHWDDERWKLLGVSIDMPEVVAKVEGTREKREERVRAPPEIRPLTEEILALLRGGKVDEVWTGAAPVFQASITRAELAKLEASRREVLGLYRRILDVTASRQNPGQTSASLDALIEFDRAVVSATLGFSREQEVWKLASYKVVLPKPRLPTGAAAAGAGASGTR